MGASPGTRRRSIGAILELHRPRGPNPLEVESRRARFESPGREHSPREALPGSDPAVPWPDGAPASQNSVTSITVPVFVREALAQHKTRGSSYGEVILAFIEEYPTKGFLREMDRRPPEEPRVSWAELRRRRTYQWGLGDSAHGLSRERADEIGQSPIRSVRGVLDVHAVKGGRGRRTMWA